MLGPARPVALVGVVLGVHVEVVHGYRCDRCPVRFKETRERVGLVIHLPFGVGELPGEVREVSDQSKRARDDRNKKRREQAERGENQANSDSNAKEPRQTVGGNDDRAGINAVCVEIRECFRGVEAAGWNRC